MTQYQVENALHKIDGYYLPKPNEEAQRAFEHAKRETIEKMNSDLRDVQSITFDQFAGVYLRGEKTGEKPR